MNSKDAGFSLDPPIECGTGFEFVPIGTWISHDYEIWRGGVGPWTPFSTFLNFFQTVGSHMFPVRRKKTAASAASTSTPSRWSCRHKRVEGEKHCSICAALYYREVTT